MTILALLLLASPETAFDRGAVEMYPVVEPGRRDELRRAVYGPMAQADALRKQIEQAKDEAERGRLRGRLGEVYAGIEADLSAKGFDVVRLRRMPTGPLREERYAHGVVLEAPDLSPAQRALLVPLVAAADAAQQALLAQGEHLAKGLAEEDEALRQRVRSGLDQHRREIEKRFWQVAYYALAPEQMRAVRELFSPRYRAVNQLEQQMYLLPDMGASQSNRVHALFVEMESEAAADRAEAQQCAARLRDPALPAEQRKELQALQQAAGQRLQRLETAFRDSLLALLTPEQRAALQATPPILAPHERSQPPAQALRGLALREEGQALRLEELGKELEQGRQAIQKEASAAYAEMAKGGLGPESPQMMTMESMRRGAQGRVVDLVRALGQRLVLEVLQPGQLTLWMVTPG